MNAVVGINSISISILRGALIAAIIARMTHDYRLVDVRAASRSDAKFAAVLVATALVGWADPVSGVCLALLVVMGQV